MEITPKCENLTGDLASSTSSVSSSDFKWSVFNGAKSPLKLIAVYIALALTFGLGVILLHSLYAGFVGCCLIALSVRDFLFPKSYRLTDTHAQAKCFGVVCDEIKWSDVKSVYRVNGGIKLSPNSNPLTSKTEDMRGFVLQTNDDSYRDIASAIERLSAISVQTFIKKDSN